MSSGDPLVFSPVLFSFPTSPHNCFLFSFFSSDSQLFIVFACAFFLLLFFFSISLVFFHSMCHCINNSLFVFIYMSIVRHKNHNIPWH